MELTPDYEAYKRLVLLRQQSHFLVEKIKRKIVQLTKVAFGKVHRQGKTRTNLFNLGPLL
jgi:hypothetical protein